MYFASERSRTIAHVAHDVYEGWVTVWILKDRPFQEHCNTGRKLLYLPIENLDQRWFVGQWSARTANNWCSVRHKTWQAMNDSVETNSSNQVHNESRLTNQIMSLHCPFDCVLSTGHGNILSNKNVPDLLGLLRFSFFCTLLVKLLFQIWTGKMRTFRPLYSRWLPIVTISLASREHEQSH